jgi:hypothetical protein
VAIRSIPAADYRRVLQWTAVLPQRKSLRVPDPVTAGTADPAVADPEPGPAPADPTGPATDRAPAWFEAGVVVLVSAMAGTGVVGLGLGLLGWYRTWAALGAGAAAGVAAALVLRGSLERTPVSRSSHRAAMAVLVLVGAGVVFAALTPSQNVLVTRDPGSYTNTALWLSRTGGLELDVDQGVFGDVPALRYEGAGVYRTEDDELQFQFNHLASTLLAASYDVGGDRLLLRAPALAMGLGLLALYAVSVRVTRRPYLSLVAVALMGLAMPSLYLARNTYSEPFTLALLWGALLLAGLLHRRPRAVVGVLLGLLLGALVGVRVDALSYVALAFPLAAVSILSAEGELRRRRLVAWAAVALTGLAAGAVGWWDLVDRSGHYARDLAPLIAQLRRAVLASLVVSVLGGLVWWRWEWLRRSCRRISAPVAAAASVAVVLVMALLWLVRPQVQTVVTGTPFPAVAVLQERAGLRVEPARTYYEESLWWMAWYLGVPALVAAIAGAAVITRRFLLGRAGPWAAGTLALCLGAGSLYWWNPSITPDHLWAMRRFVPAVLPGLCVLAVVAVVAVDDLWGRRLRRSWTAPTRGAAAVLAVGLLLVPPALTTWPLRWQRDQGGYLLPVRSACEVVGDDGAVIVVGGAASITLPQTLRSWCGVPVAAQGDAIGAELATVTVAEIAAELAEEGRDLYLVAEHPWDLGGYVVEDGPTIIPTDGADDRWSHWPTLTEAPDEYRGLDRDSAVTSPFQLWVLPVDPA